MAVTVYRTYRFMDKDPVIDKMRTLIQDQGLMKKLELVHQLSGVSTSTLVNWFDGDTKSPQNRTIMAVVSSLGYKVDFVHDKDLDIEKELRAAKAWAEKQAEKNETARKEASRRVKRAPGRRSQAEHRVRA